MPSQRFRLRMMLNHIRDGSYENGQLNYTSLCEHLRGIIDRFETLYSNYTATEINATAQLLSVYAGAHSFAVRPYEVFQSHLSLVKDEAEDVKRRIEEGYTAIVDFCKGVFDFRRVEWGIKTPAQLGLPISSDFYDAIDWIFDHETTRSLRLVVPTEVTSEYFSSDEDEDEDEVELTDMQKLDVDVAMVPSRYVLLN